MITRALIYGYPDADPRTDRVVLERAGLRTILVPVAEEPSAFPVTADLVEHDQVELLEFCSGFSAVDAAQVIEAVEGRVPVRQVAYALESVGGASAYTARSAESGHDGDAFPGRSQLIGVPLGTATAARVTTRLRRRYHCETGSDDALANRRRRGVS